MCHSQGSLVRRFNKVRCHYLSQDGRKQTSAIIALNHHHQDGRQLQTHFVQDLQLDDFAQLRLLRCCQIVEVGLVVVVVDCSEVDYF